MPLSVVTDRASRRRREGIKVALVSALFVVLGLALRDRVPWYATAFFALCLAGGVVSIWWEPPDVTTDRLVLDETGVTRTAPKLREHVAWGDLARVRILTTDQGPRQEDVFFILDSRQGDGCVVSHDLAVRAGLLKALQERCAGLDNGAVIDAMLSAGNAVFTIWEAESGS
jgi:hypothetical protein